VRAEHDADAPEHFHCLDSLIAAYAKQSKHVKVLLVTASVELQQNAVKRYKDILLLPNNKVDGIIDVHDRKDAAAPSERNATKQGLLCTKLSSEPHFNMVVVQSAMKGYPMTRRVC
jgi:hypothetical protein